MASRLHPGGCVEHVRQPRWRLRVSPVQSQHQRRSYRVVFSAHASPVRRGRAVDPVRNRQSESNGHPGITHCQGDISRRQRLDPESHPRLLARQRSSFITNQLAISHLLCNHALTPTPPHTHTPTHPHTPPNQEAPSRVQGATSLSSNRHCCTRSQPIPSS